MLGLVVGKEMDEEVMWFRDSRRAIPVVELPSAADAKTEAFFAQEGGAAVGDVHAIGFFGVPVQHCGEFFCGILVIALKVVNRAGRHGKMDGFGAGVFGVVWNGGAVVLKLWMCGVVMRGVAGNRNGLTDGGGDEAGGNVRVRFVAFVPGIQAAAAFSFFWRDGLQEDLAIFAINPRRQPPAGVRFALSAALGFLTGDCGKDRGAEEDPLHQKFAVVFGKACRFSAWQWDG